MNILEMRVYKTQLDEGLKLGSLSTENYFILLWIEFLFSKSYAYIFFTSFS
jgi:hypothetical protein